MYSELGQGPTDIYKTTAIQDEPTFFGAMPKIGYNLPMPIQHDTLMLPVFLLSLMLLPVLSHAGQQSPLYQVDMILFAHQQAPQQPTTLLTPLLAPAASHAIALQNTVSSALTPYHTLPANASQLSSEYWALSRKTDYHVLAHYSWIQPANNQQAVALPTINHSGWNVEGTLRVRRSNYYLLDTELLFSTQAQNQTTFLFSQQQRLKPGTVYYLDHPQAGMLIKVHQIT